MDGKPTIMLPPTNLKPHHPPQKGVDAAVEATKTPGGQRFGPSDCRHHGPPSGGRKEVAAFKRAEAALIYSAGYTANVGFIPQTPVRGSEDPIISDEFNHGLTLDGVRLTKASRAVYAHNDMGALEEVLIANKAAERKLIITDGVFSMDGDIAPLDDIVALAEEHDAMIMVDDCHGEGVLGEGGRGIVDHFNVHGKVEFEIGSFSKALGVQGGIMAGSELSRQHALNHSRSWLLSGSQPPGVAGSPAGCHSGAAGRTGTPPALVGQHRVFPRGTAEPRFRYGRLGDADHSRHVWAIKDRQGPPAALADEGVMAGAIVFPMVARDKARVRTQMSAGLTRDDLDDVLRIFEARRWPPGPDLSSFLFGKDGVQHVLEDRRRPQRWPPCPSRFQRARCRRLRRGPSRPRTAEHAPPRRPTEMHVERTGQQEQEPYQSGRNGEQPGDVGAKHREADEGHRVQDRAWRGDGRRLEKRAMMRDAKPSNMHAAMSKDAWKIHVGHQMASRTTPCEGSSGPWR
ncbi:MAG: hypothetical protein CM15mP18_0340 [Methanobacteriota archaeon]|nr:MAG: hypothetical protein CM15mP18_0340 [Euryarchaeota archaeon]